MRKFDPGSVPWALSRSCLIKDEAEGQEDTEYEASPPPTFKDIL